MDDASLASSIPYLKRKKIYTDSSVNFFGRKYGLDDNTVDFIGHALALHRDDRYLDEPAFDTVKRMKVKNAWDT